MWELFCNVFMWPVFQVFTFCTREPGLALAVEFLVFTVFFTLIATRR